MRARKSRFGVFIIPIFIGGIILYGIYLGVQRSHIVKDFKITTAHIVDLGYHQGRFKAGGSYFFFADGIKYTGEFARGNVCDDIARDQVPSIDEKYLVAYKSGSPEINDILLSPERFKRYGIEFTDERRAALIPFFICED